jgi:hypothetical protein
MLRVLMEPEATPSQEFLDQIQEKVQRGSYQRLFYDITGWSMPLTYHVEAYEVGEIPGVATELVTEAVEVEGEVVNPGAEYGFLVPYDSNAALEVLARFRREGLIFRVALEPFTVDGRPFGPGTLAVFGRENGNPDLGSIVADVAEESGATVVGVDGPLSEEGRHVGSNVNLVPVPGGRIAVAMDRPVDPTDFGSIWYMFERTYGIEFTALRFEELAEADLDEYGVIILPDGNYAGVRSALAVDVAAHLKAWIQRGGRLVALRNASAWVARKDFGITDARVKDPGEEAGAVVPQIPGAIMRARVADPEHPLAFGYRDEIPVMVWSRLAFEGPAGMEAPIRIAEAERARVSGFAFPESLEYVGGTPYVVRERRGEGTVVLFLDDPNFRSFWEGLTRMFFNAVFFSGVS